LAFGLASRLAVDADLAEHADHGLADRLVVDVAVVRAVEDDFKPSS
jgi:hypothetical protein